MSWGNPLATRNPIGHILIRSATTCTFATGFKRRESAFRHYQTYPIIGPLPCTLQLDMLGIPFPLNPATNCRCMQSAGSASTTLQANKWALPVLRRRGREYQGLSICFSKVTHVLTHNTPQYVSLSIGNNLSSSLVRGWKLLNDNPKRNLVIGLIRCARLRAEKRQSETKLTAWVLSHKAARVSVRPPPAADEEGLVQTQTTR